MPRNTTGYERIAQAEFSDDSDDELVNGYSSLQSPSASQYAPITQHKRQGSIHADDLVSATPRRPRNQTRMRRNSSGVDIKAINARLERWADEIASKFKINKVKGKTQEEEKLEIHHSVFQAPDGIRPATAESLRSDGEVNRMSKEEFDAIIESVRIAIEQGIHPKMISQGSSGSYFARNSDGKVVGVFKPKDEEPYAAGNPKWNKWIHRNLFPCFFGRACLIPNLSYVSEAAAYTLDCRLRTNLVPYTDIVWLSSRSFHYDFWARRNYYRKKKLLPPKVGSFQVFLKGYKDANIFLREHPWPDQVHLGFRSSTSRPGGKWTETCRPNSTKSDDEDSRSGGGASGSEEDRRQFTWTEPLKQSFREELEKLVILDYIMRNTDRGLDNWMIKVDWESQGVSIVSEPLQMNTTVEEEDTSPRLVSVDARSHTPDPYRPQQPMDATSRSGTPSQQSGPSISIGAIDNSLSWPWKHPDAWRSFPFGWLFLPVSLIGQPFSQKTRDHFLPLLTSKQWWSETQLELRRVFSQDADFQERMFARQIAVMKGQAWNVVETLKTIDHGPLELTRRARVCVWDDLVDIPIATPMRVPSTEMRRRSKLNHSRQFHEEMDISAANASAPQPDLLASPPADLPNPNRFELTSPRASEDTPRSIPESPVDSTRYTSKVQAQRGARPPYNHTRSRVSYDGTIGFEPQYTLREQARRFSLSSRSRGMSQSLHDGDEGDLGYAAAEVMDGHHRKVIVERLEMVKAKNPVFTWC
ncbi:phosphatidylinositol 3 and 4-kinase-domain-containing protein [Xylogone sp. PMI_703]|nr:phosphatidylinositol 3 and 4-kinase-domain-containing protein [Xylogone sp. PMI_703]